jgi:hypothetical protein
MDWILITTVAVIVTLSFLVHFYEVYLFVTNCTRIKELRNIRHKRSTIQVK